MFSLYINEKDENLNILNIVNYNFATHYSQICEAINNFQDQKVKGWKPIPNKYLALTE